MRSLHARSLRDGKLRPLAIAVALAITALVQGLAMAADSLRSVVLVVAEREDHAVTLDALTRIDGELRLAAFTAERQTLVIGSDPLGTLELALAPGKHIAALTVIKRAHDAEVWVTDQQNHRSLVQRLPLPDEPQRAAAVIAFSAVELMRALLGELWPHAPVAVSPMAVTTPPTSQPAIVEQTSAWQLSIFALGRVHAHEGLLAAGGGVGLDRKLGPRLLITMEAALARGGYGISIGQANALAADFGLFSALTSAARVTNVRAELGARFGIVRVSGDLDQAQGYRGRSGLGPWGGPAARVSLRRTIKNAAVLCLSAEAGWALIATTASVSDVPGTSLSLGGPWVAITLGMGLQ